VQTTGLAPVHVPAWQVSACVQASPSLHAVPFAFSGFEHTPEAGLQVPTAWHWSEAVQTTLLPPTQLPFWHVSVWVQALLSPHGAPLGEIGFEHRPVAGLHVPTAWHWSDAVQTMELLPMQLPSWQVSVCVQPFPSLQRAPPGEFGVEHSPVAGLHVPTSWHWSSEVQTTALPTQMPAWHASVSVQALPSLQAMVLLGFRQPSAGSQLSVVQTLPSLQAWWFGV